MPKKELEIEAFCGRQPAAEILTLTLNEVKGKGKDLNLHDYLYANCA